MALQSYARLRSNGTPIEGLVSTTQMGSVDVSTGHIEVSHLAWGATSGARTASGVAAARGRREYSPITFVKRVDASTPLLYQALAQNRKVDGEFLLFEIDPSDGTVRLFFTVTAEDGAIVEIASVSPDVRDPEVATWDAYEEVSLTFARIALDELVVGTSFEDQVGQR